MSLTVTAEKQFALLSRSNDEAQSAQRVGLTCACPAVHDARFGKESTHSLEHEVPNTPITHAHFLDNLVFVAFELH